MVQSFKLALKNIWSSKMRAFLTMLGIIIGVASVIILVSPVDVYMSYMTESFASLDTNQVTVNMMDMPSRLVPADEMYEFFEENTDTFDHVTPQITVSTAVKHGSDTMSSTSVTGVSEDYLSVKSYQLQEGRSIQYSDTVSKQKVCVVGYYVATELYGNPKKAVDQTIKVGGYVYRVVSVVERQDEEPRKDGGTNDFPWMLYSCAVKISRNANINSYMFIIQNLGKVDEATELISDSLMETLKNEDLFNVVAMSGMLDSLDSMITMVSTGLGSVAGISLLMTDVDVMSVMLASVTERIRETGIRKALEAKKGIILQQPVIEAAVRSSLGSILGVTLGSIATMAVGDPVGLDASPTPSAMIISFSVSMAIGLFFEYTPAKRAVGLNPINAPRSEQDDKMAFLP